MAQSTFGWNERRWMMMKVQRESEELYKQNDDLSIITPQHRYIHSDDERTSGRRRAVNERARLSARAFAFAACAGCLEEPGDNLCSLRLKDSYLPVPTSPIFSTFKCQKFFVVNS